MTPEQIEDAVRDEVYLALGEWGTTAQVTHSDGRTESLRVLLNKRCEPLIAAVCAALAKGESNKRKAVTT